MFCRIASHKHKTILCSCEIPSYVLCIIESPAIKHKTQIYVFSEVVISTQHVSLRVESENTIIKGLRTPTDVMEPHPNICVYGVVYNLCVFYLGFIES